VLVRNVGQGDVCEHKSADVALPQRADAQQPMRVVAVAWETASTACLAAAQCELCTGRVRG
jgi:hypothetical protein